MLRRRLTRPLERLGLLGPASMLYGELAYRRSLRGAGPSPAGDGLPLPSPRLIFLVAHTADAGWYLESGELAARSLSGLLERNGLRLEERRAILDFGCGCGRVIRRLASLAGPSLAGSDLNRAAVAWCAAHLPFARFVRNGLAPPLPFGAGELDLVYALSVFTHLPETLQRDWMDELARVLEPGGHLVLSTHGERYLERLDAAERARFGAGEIVVRRGRIAGSNLCTAFHPERAVRERLARRFEVVDLVPVGALGNPHQDLWLLRRV